MFCSVSEKRGMHEFAYFSIGGLPTKSGSTASAASQYSLRDLHVNIMLNPHAATQVRMSSYERQAGSNPKVRVADKPRAMPHGNSNQNWNAATFTDSAFFVKVDYFRFAENRRQESWSANRELAARTYQAKRLSI